MPNLRADLRKEDEKQVLFLHHNIHPFQINITQ